MDLLFEVGFVFSFLWRSFSTSAHLLASISEDHTRVPERWPFITTYTIIQDTRSVLSMSFANYTQPSERRLAFLASFGTVVCQFISSVLF